MASNRFGQTLFSSFEVKVFQSRPDWFPQKEFKNILKRELNRSNRTGIPISYILINLEDNAVTSPVADSAEYYQFLEKLVELISHNTRDYGLKEIISPYKIGVLLIDTSLDGAKAFIEKISLTLFDYFEKQKKELHINLIKSIVISSYPVNQMPDCETIKARPVVLKNLQFSTADPDAAERTSYQERNVFVMDWKVVRRTRGGATAMTAPMFLDTFSPEPTLLTYEKAKRLVDILGALTGILLFFPVMLAVAVAVKLSSKGPILFRQERLGQFGRPFTFLKFRSMRTDTDASIHQKYIQDLIKGAAENHGSDDQPLYKLSNDPRITKVGHFIRKTSLDELPQFFNVLSGEMSLVGPRPPIPYEVESYKSWHLRRILDAKPGLTGIWQVYGRSTTTFDEMVRLDLQYAESRSVLTDIKLLILTPLAIFNTKGAL